MNVFGNAAPHEELNSRHVTGLFRPDLFYVTHCNGAGCRYSALQRAARMEVG